MLFDSAAIEQLKAAQNGTVTPNQWLGFMEAFATGLEQIRLANVSLECVPPPFRSAAEAEALQEAAAAAPPAPHARGRKLQQTGGAGPAAAAMGYDELFAAAQAAQAGGQLSTPIGYAALLAAAQAVQAGQQLTAGLSTPSSPPPPPRGPAAAPPGGYADPLATPVDYEALLAAAQRAQAAGTLPAGFDMEQLRAAAAAAAARASTALRLENLKQLFVNLRITEFTTAIFEVVVFEQVSEDLNVQNLMSTFIQPLAFQSVARLEFDLIAGKEALLRLLATPPPPKKAPTPAPAEGGVIPAPSAATAGGAQTTTQLPGGGG